MRSVYQRGSSLYRACSTQRFRFYRIPNAQAPSSSIADELFDLARTVTYAKQNSVKAGTADLQKEIFQKGTAANWRYTFWPGIERRT
jgi:hypothetical protein